MTSKTLTEILQYVRNFVKHNRPAYKDYLGEETVTKTTLIAEGTLVEYSEDQGLLTLKDSSFTGFVKGESYDVTIGENTYQILPQIMEGILYLSNVDYVNDIVPKLDADEEPPEFWLVVYMSRDGKNNYVVTLSHGSFAGKSISISQTKTTVEKKYDIKKLSEELLPNNIVKKSEVAAIKKLANDAKLVGAEALDEAYAAQTTANAAQTTANAAQTTANAAQTTANNSVLFEAQSLTTAQKQVARTNIGAGTDNYNDLKNKPFYMTNFTAFFAYSDGKPDLLDSDNSIYACLSLIKWVPKDNAVYSLATNDITNYRTKLLWVVTTNSMGSSYRTAVSYIGNSNILAKLKYPKNAFTLLGGIMDNSDELKNILYNENDTGDFLFLYNTARNSVTLTYSNNAFSLRESVIYQIDRIYLPPLPVDNSTIKLNDQGQLTLALSNANGVSF